MMAMFSTRWLRRSLATVGVLLTLLLPAAGRAQVIINEILADNESTAPLAEIPDYFPEYIELYNAGLTDIDLGAEGWTITDNPAITNKFQFPTNTIIYADSFLLLFCDNETNFPGIHVGFSLDAKTGETLSLFKRSGAGYVRVTQTTFGIQVPGYSVGRVPGANPDEDFTLNFPTPCGGTIPCLANTLAPFTNAPFTSNAFTLKINEWLATNSAGPNDDWLEIYNPDTNIVELSGLVIWDKPHRLFAVPTSNADTSGPKPVPSLSYIAPLGYVQFRCSGDLRPEANNLNFSISSGSEEPPGRLYDTNYMWAPNRSAVIDVVVCSLWRARNISEGRVPDGSSRIGVFPNPTPGEANFGPIPEININELLSHTDPPLEDAVEFHNLTTNDVDISYWWMSNARNTPKKYQFPRDTIVPSNGFLVVYEKDFNNTNLLGDRAFTFNSARGDECYIFKADPAGELLGFRKGVQFGAAPNGYSFGRYVTSDTNAEFVLLSDISFGTFVRAGMPAFLTNEFRRGTGAPNAPIRLSPVVINEIHFHPVGKLGLTDTNDNSEDEFIELRNVASTNVALYYQAQVTSGENPTFLTNRWKIRGNVDYDFPQTSFPVLAPNSYLLVVNFDPETNAIETAGWALRMGVAPGTALYGPYRGKLSNRQGNIELYRPDTPQVPPHPDAGLTPQILVDRAEYEDRPPWPSNSVDGLVWADGGGGSLQRRFSYEYGNDPTNWFVNRPTPGSYNSPSGRELPYFFVSPRDYIDVPPRTNLVLYAQARGYGQITYQWFRNGVFIPGETRTNLALNNVGAANIGQYYVVAQNLEGLSTSRVATVSIACPYSLSSFSATFGQPGGEGSVTVTAPGGCPWEVTGIPPWVNVTSATSFEGTGTFTFTVGPHTGTAVRSNILTIAGQSFRIAQSPPDNTRPTVAISAPASGARVTTATTAIRGTASDNFGVARVELQMGSGDFVPVSYDARAWTNVVFLQPGTNWIRVRSIDFSGNISVTNIRSVIYVVTSPLHLAIHNPGWGTVSGATNLQRLELGRGYTLTAAARPGYVFSNWTGDIPASSAAKLQFLMQPEMNLAANFVPNPFLPVKGTYYGLFSAFGAVYHTNSGSFKLTTTESGSYSASIALGGKKYSTSGKLDLFGKATNLVNRAGMAPLTVEWDVGITNEFGRGNVYGTVNAINWESAISIFGRRATFHAVTNPAPSPGKYTFVVPGLPGEELFPQGDGYGTLTISPAGLLKCSGVLADGTKFSQSVSILDDPGSERALWPLHANVYTGARGSVLGWVTHERTEFYDLDGSVTWVRPPGPAPKYYTNGFPSPLTTQLTGSLYTSPVGATSRILNLTDAQIVLTGGNLPVSPSINNVILGLSSKVTNANPQMVTLTCAFTLSTGLFTGTYREAGTTRTITFRGAVLQHPFLNKGSGHFLGTTESGQVLFEARPTPP